MGSSPTGAPVGSGAVHATGRDFVNSGCFDDDCALDATFPWPFLVQRGIIAAAAQGPTGFEPFLPFSDPLPGLDFAGINDFSEKSFIR
jgi:hypothetical protein